MPLGHRTEKWTLRWMKSSCYPFALSNDREVESADNDRIVGE